MTFFLVSILLINGEASAQLSSLLNLGQAGSQNVIVSMKDSTIPIINSLDDQDSSRDELATILTQKLKTFSSKSQSPVISLLERFNADFQSYWINNKIFIKDASPNLIASLQNLAQVKSVAKEELIPLNFVNFDLGKRPEGVEWHLKIMEVERVWRKTKGEGIIVSSIDSGVRGSHEALRDNYIGSDNFGWYDPVLFTKEPQDLGGHGSHVMGILAGSNGIGAAPESKWMACRAGLNLLMHEHALISCGQYILCPSDPQGDSKCQNVPHIISNSWGKGGGHISYEQIVKAWVKVGIKPFFAIGNDGPDCYTAASPGDYDDVIAVGNTNINDTLHESSSRGPAIRYNENYSGHDDNLVIKSVMESLLFTGQAPMPTDKIKPDIVAPGVKINSAFILTDRSYQELTGTSMATPAAAGVAALLLSIQTKMTLKELKTLLYSTTDRNLTYKKANKMFSGNTSEQCGGIPDDKFPNNLFGHGRINAYRAYKKLKKEIKRLRMKKRQSSEE